MPSLIEMMQAAQGGEAMNNLARQFGISPEQTQQAVSALLPAFSMGLQKQTESMDALGNLFQGMFAGPHAAAFDDARTAAAPETMAAGQQTLGQLFGSQAVAQQVAQHAAAVSGVSTSILQQMMPIIASMLMGGLLKGTNGSNGLGGLFGQMMGGAGGAGGLGGILGQMMGGGQPQAGNQMPGGLGDILGQMLGQGRAPAPMPGAGAGGLGDLLNQMFGGAMAGGAQPAPQAAPQQQSPAGDPMGAGMDILKSMFETGTQIQDAHLKGLQDIFDQMKGPTKG